MQHIACAPYLFSLGIYYFYLMLLKCEIVQINPLYAHKFKMIKLILLFIAIALNIFTHSLVNSMPDADSLHVLYLIFLVVEVILPDVVLELTDFFH